MSRKTEKKKKTEPQTKAIMIRISESAYRAVKAKAKSLKLETATYTRAALLESVEPKKRGRPPGSKSQEKLAKPEKPVSITARIEDALGGFHAALDKAIGSSRGTVGARLNVLIEQHAELTTEVSNLETKAKGYHDALDNAGVGGGDTATVGERIAMLIAQRDEAVLALTGLDKLTIHGGENESSTETVVTSEEPEQVPAATVETTADEQPTSHLS